MFIDIKYTVRYSIQIVDTYLCISYLVLTEPMAEGSKTTKRYAAKALFCAEYVDQCKIISVPEFEAHGSLVSSTWDLLYSVVSLCARAWDVSMRIIWFLSTKTQKCSII